MREPKWGIWKWKAKIWELTKQSLPLSWSLRSAPCSLTSAVSMELLSLVFSCQQLCLTPSTSLWLLWLLKVLASTMATGLPGRPDLGPLGPSLMAAQSLRNPTYSENKHWIHSANTSVTQKWVNISLLVRIFSCQAGDSKFSFGFGLPSAQWLLLSAFSVTGNHTSVPVFPLLSHITVFPGTPKSGKEKTRILLRYIMFPYQGRQHRRLHHKKPFEWDLEACLIDQWCGYQVIRVHWYLDSKSMVQTILNSWSWGCTFRSSPRNLCDVVLRYLWSL